MAIKSKTELASKLSHQPVRPTIRKFVVYFDAQAWRERKSDSPRFGFHDDLVGLLGICRGSIPQFPKHLLRIQVTAQGKGDRWPDTILGPLSVGLKKRLNELSASSPTFRVEGPSHPELQVRAVLELSLVPANQKLVSAEEIRYPVEVSRPKQPEISSRLKKAIEACLPAEKLDYSTLKTKLVTAKHAFMGRMAEQLENCLFQHLENLPQTSKEEKQSLCKWVNAELRELGLTLAYLEENEYVPATLVTEPYGEHGRFRVQIRKPDGTFTKRTASTSIPELSIMEAMPREEPLAKWAKATSRESGPETKSR